MFPPEPRPWLASSCGADAEFLNGVRIGHRDASQTAASEIVGIHAIQDEVVRGGARSGHVKYRHAATDRRRALDSGADAGLERGQVRKFRVGKGMFRIWVPVMTSPVVAVLVSTCKAASLTVTCVDTWPICIFALATVTFVTSTLRSFSSAGLEPLGLHLNLVVPRRQ